MIINCGDSATGFFKIAVVQVYLVEIWYKHGQLGLVSLIGSRILKIAP